MKKQRDYTLNDWAAAGLELEGKSIEGLAEALGVHRQTVRNIVDVKYARRPVKDWEIPIIETYIGVPRPTGGLVTVQILNIGVGLWLPTDPVAIPGDVSSVHRNEKYPDADHHCFRVMDDSMSADSIPKFSLVYGLSGKGKVKEGSKVVIKRTVVINPEETLIEYSVKIVSLFPDRTEYNPSSNDKTFKPVVVHHKSKSSTNETVKVVAIIYRMRADFAV